MARRPTEEEMARQILFIFVGHFHCRPEEILLSNNFLAVWHDRGLHSEDFEPGMKFAMERGWVRTDAKKDTYTLTEEGFAEA